MFKTLRKIEASSTSSASCIILNRTKLLAERIQYVQLLDLKPSEFSMQSTLFLIICHLVCVYKASKRLLLELFFHLQLCQVEKEFICLLYLVSSFSHQVLNCRNLLRVLSVGGTCKHVGQDVSQIGIFILSHMEEILIKIDACLEIAQFILLNKD